MADVQPIQDAASAYVDIAARLREITQFQETQLDQMRSMNVQSSILAKTREGHLSTEQRLASIQTSITAKTNRILHLEERRQARMAMGGTNNINLANNLAAAIARMTNEVRSANEEYTHLLRQQSMSLAGTSLLNKIGFSGLISGSKELAALWKVHPILAIGKVLEHAIEMFDKMDQSAAKFRQNMGFTRTYMANIDENARSVAINLTKVGVTADHAYQATAELSKHLFSSMTATKSLVSDVALISAQLGVTAGVASDFMKSMAMASRSTAAAQTDMTMFAASISDAAGIPLGELMQDISAATKNAYQFVSRTGMSLLKAGVEARRMGTTLASTVSSASNLLKFTDSVRSEMEASVLVGKAINLQHARELAYRRDLKGLNNEILKIIKEVNFEQLDPFQQEAVANALGKSASQLAEMAQAERERLGWETSTDPIVKRQLDAYKQMQAATEATAKARGQDMRYQLSTRANQAAIQSITQSWQAILMKLGEKFLPIIEKVLRFIADHFDDIVNLSVGVFGAIKMTVPFMLRLAEATRLTALWTTHIWTRLTAAGQAIAVFFTGAGRVAAVVRSIGAFFRPVVAWIGRAVAFMGRLIGMTGRFAGVAGTIGRVAVFFGRWLNPIGWIITGIMFIINLFKRLNGIGEAFKEGILNGILFGLKAIGGALFDTLLKPFWDAAKWIWDFFCGKSPSKIGLGILKGIQAIGTLLVDALLFPYKTAWNLIKKIPFVGRLFGGKNVGAEVQPDARAEVTVDKKPTPTTDRTPQQLPAMDKLGTELSKKLDTMIEALNALRNDMKNGALTANVYLDSQKLDSGMARRLSYTGQLTA